MAIKITLPHLFAINEPINGNTIQQIIRPSYPIQADKANFTSPTLKGTVLIPKNEDDTNHILLVNQRKELGQSFSKIIYAKKLQTVSEDYLDLSSHVWLKHPQLKEMSNHTEHLKSIFNSWENGFSFIKEVINDDEEKCVKGLREPQVGAIHAVHAHWSISNDTATIVMPTGTGKTETMISVFLSTQCGRILIVVPTDALRKQIADKFLTFGVLKDFSVVASPCLYPVVGVLNRKPKTVEEVDDFFTKCNVIVTTSQIAGQVNGVLQERMAHHCSALFIDEAHHVGAKTWKTFKNKFASRQILQFTATPFREDGKPVEGKVIFKYPLNRAQEKKFFTKINFKPVRIFGKKKRDQAIADLAVQQLREDRTKYNHILMARVNSIPRAKKVFSIYQQYDEFNPVLLHSEISPKEKEERKQKLINGDSKIVVCVDMLGEGYDLPELKIAAFHDIRNSPAITIQLAGRFTRSRPDLGDATFIANVGDKEVRSELKKLYTRDPDWNFLLPKLSEELINEQLDLNEFAEGFNNFPKEIPIQTLCPALSTVIYKTKCAEWTPENFLNGLLKPDSFEKIFHDINSENNTLIIVTAEKTRVEWTKVEDIFNWVWNLYVVFWDKEQNLLFINNSSNSGDFKKLAKAVAGDNVELIRGDMLFRCLGNITRIIFKNIGLSESGMVSYTGRMGSDVERALSELQKEKASKSVLVGTGFENGKKTSIGCSVKGRIWSHARSFHLNKLIEWCSATGRKVLDEAINPNDFLKNTLSSEFIAERPSKMPISIDWNEDIYKVSEESITFRFGKDVEKQLYEVDINLIEPKQEGDLRFEISSDQINSEFTLRLYRKNDFADYSIINDSENKLIVEWGKGSCLAEEFFYKYPPSIRFVDGTSLCGSRYTSSRKRLEPYPKEKIQAWDWTGVNIEKESQHIERRTDSVQYRVIQELKKRNYDVIFDDDASGEAADIVTIKVDDLHKIINVEFYHCKFSGEKFPGARVDDLYQVCGQSQKSIRWVINPTELFLHLLRREEKRKDEHGGTRIEIGDSDIIDEIAEKSCVYKTELNIFLVQPGLSKPKVSVEQLELLSVTESFLKETYMIPFTVIANKD
jgi:superfamily II DNA or RNA helicase